MNPTQTRPLNSRTRTPVPVTALGFGSAPLGNLYQSMTDTDAQAAMTAAYQAGIRFFDTAPMYGLGLSESRVGAALGQLGRDSVTVSTKVGRLLLDCAPDEVTPAAFVDVPQKRLVFDYTYDGVMRSYEASKARTGFDRADILLVHDIDVFSHGSRAESDAKIRELFDQGGYRALDELRSSGEISAIGGGLNEWDVCETLLGHADFDCFLLAGRYTLLEQEALNSFLPLCVERDVGIILGGPYNSGILATGAVPGAKYNYDTAAPDIMARVKKIEAVCAAHQTPLIAAALQFVMGHPAVKTVIPGARSADEVVANVSVFETSIPDALWSDLRDQGLIRPDAPLPSERDHAA